MIYRIKSIYIIKNIFSFIKDKNIELKLFIYSNYFLNKFNINRSDIYKKYLNRLDFDFNKYIFINEEHYNKDKLRKDYDDFISKNKLNKTKFENIVCKVINDQNEIDVEKYINVDSPLLEILSKTKNFEKNYTIYISQKNIDKYDLKNDYIKIFKKLKNLNIRYSSIYYIFKEEKFFYLQTLNINCNNIRKLSLYNACSLINDKSFNKIINILDLFRNLEKISIKGKKKLILKNNQLYFYNPKLNINGNEILNINTLEKVNLQKLKELNLSSNKISDITVLEKVKFDILEVLNLSDNEISDINILEKVNFKNLKELNLSRNKISDITVLEKVKFDILEILNLKYNEISDINILENSNFKELKQLYLYSNKITDIKVFKKLRLNKLEKLILGVDGMPEINILEKNIFKNLKH